MAKLEKVLEGHFAIPVTTKSYQELGQAIQNHSQPLLQDVVKSFEPKTMHQKLLQLQMARDTGCLGPLEDGLKSECKYVSEFCLKSNILFSSDKTLLLDVNFLLPLLQTVSRSTRNRILWNLGKHMSPSSNSSFTIDNSDSLYFDVVKVWGPSIAVPLLCQTSENVLKQELPRYGKLMSKCHMFIIAKRFPSLLFSIMENHSYFPPLDIAQFVVRQTIPNSLDYIVKRNHTLSKSTMKIILQNHSNVVLESPAMWANVLDCKLVKRTLTKENFELFVRKQMVQSTSKCVSYSLMSYFKLLPAKELSLLINKIFEEKFSCPLQSKLDFWEENTSLLKLLDADDRNFIAGELDLKNKLSNDWVSLMKCEKSIPKLKHLLFSEQNASNRSDLVDKLVETAIINEDQNALEDICKFVVTRYRNDKNVLGQFFGSSIDFLSLSDDTWLTVFDAAKKFFNPEDWQTRKVAKLYAVAIKREGLPALKEYLVQYMKHQYIFPAGNLENLQDELRQVCIHELFNEVNINNEDTIRLLAEFLPLITKWTATSTLPIITENVKTSVLKMLQNYRHKSCATEFVLANIKILGFHFIEDCFQHTLNPLLVSYLLSKDSSIIQTKDTAEKIGNYILEHGICGYVKLLVKLKKRGYTDVLQCIAAQSQSALVEDDSFKLRKVKTAMVLLMLSTHSQVFFSVVDPLLPIIANDVVIPGQEASVPVNAPLKLSDFQEEIYRGFGWSLSHADSPVVAYDRLLRFCVSGDLVLFVRDAIYSLCSFIPNENAQKMLSILMEQPVSVKKHSLRLLKLVSNLECQEMTLEKLIVAEKHLTIRIVLMHVVITCLNEAKSPTMWIVLRHMMNNLTPDDKTIVLELVHATIPDQYFEEYLSILLLKCKELTEVDHSSVISSILQQASKSAWFLSEKFVESLVVEYFLSERFFENLNLHSSTSDLLIKYLQGVSASSLSSVQDQDSNASSSPQRKLSERKCFLKERLDSITVETALDFYDAKKGIYPLKKLLIKFVDHFCNSCIEANLQDQRVQLTEYIELLLNYFASFNPCAVFSPFIFISLTKIFKTQCGAAGSTSFELGQEIGKFCDSMTLQSSTPLYLYNLPNAVSNFMDMLTFPSVSEHLKVLQGILATIDPVTNVSGDGSSHTLQSMFRLMVVAHVLPSNWQLNEEYRDFGVYFLPLIKNTPVEVFVFNEN